MQPNSPISPINRRRSEIVHKAKVITSELEKFEIENTSKVGTPFYLAPELIGPL